MESTYIQRTWGDAYGLALVATGRAEVMLDPVMAVWDCGPLASHPRRSRRHIHRTGRDIRLYRATVIATNGVLFGQVVAIVGEGCLIPSQGAATLWRVRPLCYNPGLIPMEQTADISGPSSDALRRTSLLLPPA